MLVSGRRILLKVLVLLILGLVAFYPQPSAGRPSSGDCTDALVDWHKKGTGSNTYRHSIDRSFNEAERELIEDALRIAVKRIQEKRTWESIQARNGYASVTYDSIALSGLCDNTNIRRNLLFHQLYWLSVPNGKNDTAQPFPDIYIRRGYEADGGWVAKAPYDTVRIFWDRENTEWRLSDDSKFVITLNNYYVAAHGIYSDPNYWAGTIAHEMLHNLGHRHPDATDPNYEKYQINLLDEVIQGVGYSYKGDRPGRHSLPGCGVK
jgi:hypothetical protein